MQRIYETERSFLLKSDLPIDRSIEEREAHEEVNLMIILMIRVDAIACTYAGNRKEREGEFFSGSRGNASSTRNP